MVQLQRLVVLLVLVLPGLSIAEQRPLPLRTSGFYGGLGVGYGSLSLDNGTISLSGEDLTFKVLGGYRLAGDYLPYDLNIAVEAAYLDLGEFSDSFAGAELDVATDGFELSAAAYYPLNDNLEVFGKAGVYAWDAEVKAAGVAQDAESSTDLALGIGVAWQTATPVAFGFDLTGFNMLDGVWAANLSATYQLK